LVLTIASCGYRIPLREPDLDLEEPVRRPVGRDLGGNAEIAHGQCLVGERLAVGVFEGDFLGWRVDEAEDPADRGLAARQHERRGAAARIGDRNGHAAALAAEVDRVLVERRRACEARDGESEYGAETRD